MSDDHSPGIAGSWHQEHTYSSSIEAISADALEDLLISLPASARDTRGFRYAKGELELRRKGGASPLELATALRWLAIGLWVGKELNDEQLQGFKDLVSDALGIG